MAPRRAIDVRVDHTDAVPAARQCDRQVGRYRRLADATLARAYRDDPAARLAVCLLAIGGQCDVQLADAGLVLQGRAGVGLERLTVVRGQSGGIEDHDRAPFDEPKRGHSLGDGRGQTRLQGLRIVAGHVALSSWRLAVRRP
jgi:hypothetical protein